MVAAAEAGVPVTCFPGASAVTTALALSGLSVGRFIFDGFVPRKAGQRQKWLESLRSESRGGLFESPHRLAETLAQAVEVLGVERNAVVCRELTKKFEEIRRGSLGDLAEWAVDNARGKITVVLDGGSAQVMSVESVLPEVEKLVASGMRLKGACKHVTEGTGVSNRDLYQAALQKP